MQLLITLLISLISFTAFGVGKFSTSTQNTNLPKKGTVSTASTQAKLPSSTSIPTASTSTLTDKGNTLGTTLPTGNQQTIPTTNNTAQASTMPTQKTAPTQQTSTTNTTQPSANTTTSASPTTQDTGKIVSNTSATTLDNASSTTSTTKIIPTVDTATITPVTTTDSVNTSIVSNIDTATQMPIQTVSKTAIPVVNNTSVSIPVDKPLINKTSTDTNTSTSTINSAPQTSTGSLSSSSQPVSLGSLPGVGQMPSTSQINTQPSQGSTTTNSETTTSGGTPTTTTSGGTPTTTTSGGTPTTTTSGGTPTTTTSGGTPTTTTSGGTPTTTTSGGTPTTAVPVTSQQPSPCGISVVGQTDCPQDVADPVCGNHVREGNEECDGKDGVIAGTYCNANCILHQKVECPEDTDSTQAICTTTPGLTTTGDTIDCYDTQGHHVRRIDQTNGAHGLKINPRTNHIVFNDNNNDVRAADPIASDIGTIDGYKNNTVIGFLEKGGKVLTHPTLTGIEVKLAIPNKTDKVIAHVKPTDHLVVGNHYLQAISEDCTISKFDISKQVWVESPNKALKTALDGDCSALGNIKEINSQLYIHDTIADALYQVNPVTQDINSLPLDGVKGFDYDGVNEELVILDKNNQINTITRDELEQDVSTAQLNISGSVTNAEISEDVVATTVCAPRHNKKTPVDKTGGDPTDPSPTTEPTTNPEPVVNTTDPTDPTDPTTEPSGNDNSDETDNNNAPVITIDSGDNAAVDGPTSDTGLTACAAAQTQSAIKNLTVNQVLLLKEGGEIKQDGALLKMDAKGVIVGQCQAAMADVRFGGAGGGCSLTKQASSSPLFILLTSLPATALWMARRKLSVE